MCSIPMLKSVSIDFRRSFYQAANHDYEDGEIINPLSLTDKLKIADEDHYLSYDLIDVLFEITLFLFMGKFVLLFP